AGNALHKFQGALGCRPSRERPQGVRLLLTIVVDGVYPFQTPAGPPIADARRRNRPTAVVHDRLLLSSSIPMAQGIVLGGAICPQESQHVQWKGSPWTQTSRIGHMPPSRNPSVRLRHEAVEGR